MKRTAILSALFRLSVMLQLLFISINGAHTQISPGQLTQAHAHLEGLTNCTQCHVLGDKVTNEKCLACHKEIKTRLDQRKGFHSSLEVSGKECISCHSDHHGRNFDILRFDITRFDHRKTGYELTGAHRTLECKECHKDEHIESAEIRKKEETYLGLKTECISCHEDVHQKSLSINCASCHNTTEFAPATLFDHAQSDFPLMGKHKTVDCKDCHEITVINGKEFQRFAEVAHNSCVSCHDDMHKGAFGTQCKDCHNEESFTQLAGKSTFNHGLTDFPLLGKHRKVDCASCHQMTGNVTAQNAFQDFRNKDFRNCATCHKDVHESKFGTTCNQCHTEESFQKRLHPELFKHEMTGYALEGKHTSVDCRQCHETKMTDPLPHENCIDCHDDYHEGQLLQDNKPHDCRFCHVVQGFEESTYTVEQHNATEFPLTGAHQATPCFSCHQQEEKWTFKGLDQACMDCHDDVHEGFLSEQYYPQKTCNQCHVPDSWSSISFNHTKTKFELLGKHAQISCKECHQPENASIPSDAIRFTGLQQACVGCHEDIHAGQFAQEGTTECKACHGFDRWKPSLFDHNKARFVLDGAHIRVDCIKCHKQVIINDKPVIKYKIDRFECIDCHS